MRTQKWLALITSATLAYACGGNETPVQDKSAPAHDQDPAAGHAANDAPSRGDESNDGEGTKRPEYGAGPVVLADAPEAITAAHLGRPLDVNFHSFSGTQGASLFPKAGPPTQTTQAGFRHEKGLIQTVERLNASLSVWKFDFDAATAKSKRFAFYRAVQTTSVYELNDATEMRAAPAGAVYYPWRIYMGHSYYRVFYGDESNFTLNAGLGFIASASASVFLSTQNVSDIQGGCGMDPIGGDAIFAEGDDIKEKYTTTGAQPCPVLVEYRQIPGAKKANESISWSSDLRAVVRMKNVLVHEDGSPGSTAWRLWAACSVDNLPGESFWIMQDRWVDAGGSVSVDASTEMPLKPGSTVTCSAQGAWGTTWDSITTGKLPPSTASVTAGAGRYPMKMTGTGGDKATGYTIDAEIEFIPKVP